MKTRISVLITLIIVSLFSMNSFAAEKQTSSNANQSKITTYEKPGKIIERTEDFIKAAENNFFSLFVKTSSGEFYVFDKLANQYWYSNPTNRAEDTIATGINKTDLNSQLWISYVGKENNEELMNSRVGSERKDGVKVWQESNGFKVVYEFPDLGISIPVLISIDDESLDIHIVIKDIVEKSDYRLYNLKVYPYFAAGGENETGYLFVPDGSGAIINYNNYKSNFDEYSQKIYGDDLSYDKRTQSTITKQVNLPVFGAKTNDKAYVAIIEKGEEYGYINAFVSGQKSSYNSVYAGFKVRYDYSFSLNGVDDIKTYDKNPILLKDISTRYYFLSGEQANYSGMAERVRSYLINQRGAKEKKYKNGLYLDLLGSVKKQSYFLGIPYIKNMPLTTYKQADKMILELKNSGIDTIVANYAFSTKDEIDEKISKKISAAGILGSRNLFQKLFENNSDSISIASQINLVHFIKDGNGINRFFNATRDPSKAVSKIYSYKSSTFYVDSNAKSSFLLDPVKIKDVVTGVGESKQVKSTENVNVKDFGTILYSNNNGKIGREACKEQIVAAFQQLDKDFKKIMAENINFYAIPYVDYIFNLPQISSGFLITDEDVPFFQMVVSGICGYSSDALNLADNPKTALLKAVETGSGINYSLFYDTKLNLSDSKANNLFSSQYGTTKMQIVNTYQKINDVFKKTNGSRIVSHSFLQPGVTMTTYQNKTVVIVNYNDKDIAVNGTDIKPMDYVVTGGEVK